MTSNTRKLAQQHRDAIAHNYKHAGGSSAYSQSTWDYSQLLEIYRREARKGEYVGDIKEYVDDVTRMMDEMKERGDDF